jgi:hypothetical protein
MGVGTTIRVLLTPTLRDNQVSWSCSAEPESARHLAPPECR